MINVELDCCAMLLKQGGTVANISENKLTIKVLKDDVYAHPISDTEIAKLVSEMETFLCRKLTCTYEWNISRMEEEIFISFPLFCSHGTGLEK